MCGELSTCDPIGIAVAQSPEAGSGSVPSAIQIPSSQGGSRRGEKITQSQVPRWNPCASRKTSEFEFSTMVEKKEEAHTP